MKRAAYSPITSWDEIPLILDIPLICRMLGKSYEGVKKMCQRGRIPAFKAGDEWRFEKADIQNWIEENKNTQR
mgnify:CR=1 FL=1